MTTYVLLYWMMLHISASLLYVFLLLWHVRRFRETQHPACSLISPSSWTHCRLDPTHRGQRDATFDLSAPWRVFGSAYLRQAAPFCVSEIATMRRSPPWSQVVKFQWDRPFRKQCWVDNSCFSSLLRTTLVSKETASHGKQSVCECVVKAGVWVSLCV